MPEAAALDLRDELAGCLSAPRDDVESAAERVPAEEHRGPANHLDALHVAEWDQVEIDLLDGWLVQADPVEEDADSLRETRDGRSGESAKSEGRLERVALLVLERDARAALEKIGENRRARRSELLAFDDIEWARQPPSGQRGGHRRRCRDVHRGQRNHLVTLVSGAQGSRLTADRDCQHGEGHDGSREAPPDHWAQTLAHLA